MNIDFFLLQEHLHLRQNVYKITSEQSNYESFILPAYKTNEHISAGRPSGGLCIFWKATLNGRVRIIKAADTGNSNRV